MRTLVFVSIIVSFQLGCKSQTQQPVDTEEVKHQSVNPDDCKIRAKVIAIEDVTKSLKIEIDEVLLVGFGFQSSLYKGQLLNINYDQKIEQQVSTLKPDDEFIGIVTSEPGVGDIQLILSAINITPKN